MRTKAILLAWIGLLVFSSLNIGASGAAAPQDYTGLDPTFGDGGKVVLDAPGYAYSVIVLPDGKILVGGTRTVQPVSGYRVARLNADGSLDSTFGDDGYFLSDQILASSYLGGTSMVVSNGKIILGGVHRNATWSENFMLMQLSADGRIDQNFGNNGSILVDFGTYSSLLALAVQPDGKIVAAGSSARAFALARFNSDGSLDASFGTNGKLTHEFPPLNPDYPNGSQPGYAQSVLVQPDGKIVATGYLTDFHGASARDEMAMARYLPDGTLDPSFGDGGTVIHGPTGRSVGLDDQGRIVVGGEVIVGSGVSPASLMWYLGVERFNSDGSRDNGFGTFDQRTQHWSIHNETRAGVNDILIQPDGKILVNDGGFVLGRFDDAGSPDTSFGIDGWMPQPFPGESNSTALALQSDGKVLLAGTTHYYDRGHFAIARFNQDTHCAIQFSDVAPGDFYAAGIEYLLCHRAISGYSDGTFRPFAPLTRGQAVKIIVEAQQRPIGHLEVPMFSDVPSGSTFFPYVQTAAQANIVSGYGDGTFRPSNPVTRGQLAAILVRAMGWEADTSGGPHFSDVPVENPFYTSIETAYANGVISGYADGTFRWQASTTRGQAAKIIALALTYIPQK